MFCLKNVLKHTGNGSIVLFHDSLKAQERLEYVLPRAMEVWNKEGYEFKSIRLLNPAILDKYKIAFKYDKSSTRGRWLAVEQIIPTDNNFHLCCYFINMGVEIFQDVLTEIDKAMEGLPFDEDGGGSESYLTIGSETSNFESANPRSGVKSIPTKDIRDILILWIDWVYRNNFEDIYIG